MSINKIDSAICNSLMNDECTTKKLRVSYARVVVEVGVLVELKDVITIRDPKGNKMLQKVKYKWRLPFCKKCNKIGHECDMKPKQKQIGQVKQV